MPRKTRKTIRRYKPVARKVIKLANEAHRISAALMALAEVINDKEFDSDALQKFFASQEVRKAGPDGE